jgi:hypothetical protein
MEVERAPFFVDEIVREEPPTVLAFGRESRAVAEKTPAENSG